ncbi:MAG TPA: phosphatase PAP2 family protein [Thermoanaerobaculia bacterium]|nr:phosphatase PAP2 family protein [Thermoanaerobaculia bacterium]
MRHQQATPRTMLGKFVRACARMARRRRELLALLSLLAASGGMALFFAIADVADEGEPHALDTELLLALRAPGDPSDPLGPVWVEELARDVTALGGIGLLTFWTLAVAGFLFLDRKPHAAWLALVSAFGGMALVFGLKGAFDRPRPDLVSHGTEVLSASFPSAHSMMSAVVYLTLGALLARLRRSWVLRFYLIGVALVLTLAVGFSRVYLGVHWPTDVLAGWSVGAAWALGCWTVARWLQHRGDVEDASDVDADDLAFDDTRDDRGIDPQGTRQRAHGRARRAGGEQATARRVEASREPRT